MQDVSSQKKEKPEYQKMKCESCKIKEYEVKEPSGEGQNPYFLCKECQFRLLNRALRPLEFFNLASIHGDTPLLHDDFYL